MSLTDNTGHHFMDLENCLIQVEYSWLGNLPAAERQELVSQPRGSLGRLLHFLRKGAEMWLVITKFLYLRFTVPG